MLRSIFLLLVTLTGVAGAQAEQRVLGKVGQSLAEFGIHRTPSATSHVYYEVQPYEYLVVTHTRNSKWLAVALNTGGYGYAPASEIAILPYTVRQTVRATTYRSPGYSSGSVGSRGASSVAAYAQNFVGTPYKFGGTDLSSGIDCSAFVKKMFGAIGVDLPRTAAEQAWVGEPITRLEDLRAGDRLYFWESKRKKIGHTGIYLGNGYFVHSSSGLHGVSTSPLTAGWIKLLVAARR